jgi:formylglycine-generating enzyme required for sulfatase activity
MNDTAWARRAMWPRRTLLLASLLLGGCLVNFTPGTNGNDNINDNDNQNANADDGGLTPDGGPDAGNTCNPTSCAGCCDLADVCQTGITNLYCGAGGGLCQDCTITSNTACANGVCEDLACQDNDGDGYGTDCIAGDDACDNDDHNWTAAGCAACADNDGDGYRGTGCDLSEDPCDSDDHNWTASGCASCTDADGDFLRGSGCDLAEDCDDNAPGVGECQANGCPIGWVHIPTGDFQRGCNSGELDGTCETDEQPRHTVTLSAYCIQVTEVSVTMFRSCRSAGVCNGTPNDTGTSALCNWTSSPAAREPHPINCLPWASSREYCQAWLGGDFPTEAQWEKGARGASPDQRKYPWGDSPEPGCTRSNYEYCYSATAPATWPVGYLSGGAGNSPYGLMDMAGNVWEWTLDTYDDNIYADCQNGCTDPVNTTAGTHVVIRGGGFHHPLTIYHRVTAREMEEPTREPVNTGIRCVRTP